MDGELLDGRRGLVPSNYVERLVGEDLVEFHSQVVLGVRDTNDPYAMAYHDTETHHDDPSRLIIGNYCYKRT